MGIPGYLDARRDSCFLSVKVPPKHGHLSECPAPVAAQGVTFGMLGVALGGFLLQALQASDDRRRTIDCVIS